MKDCLTIVGDRLDLFLIGTVLAASAHDLALRRIPNRLLLAALLCAAALQLASGAPLSLLSTGLAGSAVISSSAQWW